MYYYYYYYYSGQVHGPTQKKIMATLGWCSLWSEVSYTSEWTCSLPIWCEWLI